MYSVTREELDHRLNVLLNSRMIIRGLYATIDDQPLVTKEQYKILLSSLDEVIKRHTEMITELRIALSKLEE